MTFTDLGDDRRLRCRRHLSTLWTLALGQNNVAFPQQAADEIRDAANSILIEVEAMSRALPEGGRRDPGAEAFLWARVTRLAMTADHAVDAARRGDPGGLVGHLRNFETMMSALWTVRDAM